MDIIVKKFGGTSVSDVENIRNVAAIITKEKNLGNKIVVVVSAMAGVTDELVRTAKKFGGVNEFSKFTEYDVIASSGEQISSALLALALQSMNCKSRSWMGWQLPIKSDNNHGKARIKTINSENIYQSLLQDEVPIIAGFQSVNSDNRITTLGRGGSDTTAAAISAVINAKRCDIYTDVEGVFTADPRIVKNAKKLDRISYEEMLEMSSLGAKVLHTRSVEIAMKYKIPMRVVPSFKEEVGTMLITDNKSIEDRLVTAITYSNNEARIILSEVPVEGSILTFDLLAKQHINIDLIVQSLKKESGFIDLTFTVAKLDFEKTINMLEQEKKKICYKSIETYYNVSKVSVVGVGMKSHAGVAIDIFRSLFDKGIKINIVSTSETRVSVLVSDEYTELAVRTLHNIFELDK